MRFSVEKPHRKHIARATGDVFHAYEPIMKYFDTAWKLSGAVALGYPAKEGKVPRKKPIDQVTEFPQ